MESVWERIEAAIEAKPEGRGRAVAWLVEQTGYGLSRINNWKARGVPIKEHETIAKVLGWDVDAVAGRQPVPRTPWPFTSIPRERFDALTPAQAGAVETALRDAILKEENAAREALSWKRRTVSK